MGSAVCMLQRQRGEAGLRAAMRKGRSYVPPGLREASPMVVAESETHVAIVLEINKRRLLRDMRFLENLIDARSGRAPDEEPP